MNIVLISGSARVDSYNTALLNFFSKLLKNEDSIFLYNKTYSLPIFSPTIESQLINNDFQTLCEKIQNADYVIYSSPEYIHSIPGGLKNLFDWIVGTGVLDNKKAIIIVATSSPGEYAMSELKEILNVLTANQVQDDLSFIVSGIKTKFNSNLELIDEEVKLKLNNLYETLSQHRTT